MMTSKQKDAAPAAVSPVLFMTVDGEPMSFFLRPGPAKRKLQPLISAGGGMMCNMQQPGAILLINPEERSSIPESTAHRYVSTQYIEDCIEKEEQLNIEDYRLNPEVQKPSAKLNTSKGSSPGLSGGRIHYTPEEDEAILKYVRKHKAEIGGNRLWQEMEKQRLTCHSWQSMKYRYRVRLAKKQSEFVDVETKEEDNKPAEEMTEVDAQVSPSGSRTDKSDAPTSTSPVAEDQHVNRQVEEEAAENTQVETVEAEPPPSLQIEGPRAELQTDTQLNTSETTQPERHGPQETFSPQKQSLEEDSAPTQSEPSLKTPSSAKKTKEKLKATPEQNLPERRMTRRRLELEASSTPEPYGKKLRSSSTAQWSTPSPQSSKKTKSAEKSTSKRPRVKTVAAEEEVQREQSGPTNVCETTQADEPTSPPQKKKDKRPLGILELAAKEFEHGSESDEDETPDLQRDTAETAATSTKAHPPPSDTAADPAPSKSNPQPEPEPEPIVQEEAPQAACPQPAAAAAAAAEPPVSEAVNATSKAHLFIFDSESQEQASQSIFGSAAPPDTQPAVQKAAAFSLTQVQLEEDKQRIRELMKQTQQDLVSVTKALLKTSGDFSAALDLLLNPTSISGPFWHRHDDNLLLSDDPDVRQELQEKYGEENVAKRIMFLEVEG
ncbi:telomeric repeat-binding factor 2-interacting protein 1 isoform X2 [Mugil cephalus]|uniref:telomeric repeat-binding factor 2-interacting protein 1 isoform X2 n=1 Tax=Mugil cephalus TaxID=48193 RepID=UPI001FB7244A|nr:telomeric repeat-binding factor 2-interacting protein 1 isoform X2 [Mugil cephalus]